ncbi:MAG: tetratricopeptide repeat protein, partial [Alphaproteobacteria bacterium]|nr:tetratricopeptide repeat protein [Alphaproteobacteria bacterium]
MTGESDTDLLTRALRAQQAGRSDDAAALCRQVLAQLPGHPHALLMLGLILGRDDADAGAPLIEQYLAQYPDDAVASCNLGLLRQRQGDAAAAAVLFDRALARQPDLAAAHHGRGVALHQLGKLDAAGAAFERAVALGAVDAVTRNNLGDLRRDQGRLDDALAEFDAAVAEAPGFATAHVNRGMVLARLRRFPEAIAALQRALALDGTLVGARLELAEALEAVRLPDEARRQRSAAYQREPVAMEACESPAARVLLLCSADRRDVSARFLLDPARFAKTHLFLLRPQDGGPHAPAVIDALPSCDLVFNTIADPDLGEPYFTEVAALGARLGRPLLNPPDRLPATRRDRLRVTLAGIPNLLV